MDVELNDYEIKQEKLKTLNSMKTVDTDLHGGEVIYILVENNLENIKKLKKVVDDVGTYLKEYGDPDGHGDTIDISHAGFIYAGADLYKQGKFVTYTKDQLLDIVTEQQQDINQMAKSLHAIRKMVRNTLEGKHYDGEKDE